MSLFEYVHLPKNDVNEQKRLIQYVSKYVAQEFSKMTEPCYYLKISKVWRDIVYLTGIDKEVIRDFKKSLPREFDVRKIFSDPSSVLIVIVILYYMKLGYHDGAKLFYRLLALRFYSSTIHKFMKYCDPEMWSFALDRLSSKHLFKVKNGVSNGILYLADVEFEKKWESYKSGLRDESKFVNDLVYNLRHRINQSFRSFSGVYYKYSEDENVTVRAERDDEDRQDRGFIPDKISISIATHGQIDTQAVAFAIKKSSIRPDLASYIVDQVSEVNNREKLKFILILMDRVIDLTSICVERNRNLLVRRVMSDVKIHKYHVRSTIEEFLNEIDVDYKIRTASSLQVVSFFCNYLTHYIQRKMCS